MKKIEVKKDLLVYLTDFDFMQEFCDALKVELGLNTMNYKGFELEATGKIFIKFD